MKVTANYTLLCCSTEQYTNLEPFKLVFCIVATALTAEALTAQTNTPTFILNIINYFQSDRIFQLFVYTSIFCMGSFFSDSIYEYSMIFIDNIINYFLINKISTLTKKVLECNFVDIYIYKYFLDAKYYVNNHVWKMT